MKSFLLKHLMVTFVILCVPFFMIACTTSLSPEKKQSAEEIAKIFDAARNQLQISHITARSETDPIVLVHYMPWFQAPPVEDKGYGPHWHMGGLRFDPYATLPDGRANIASWYYPLTGPYDSRDKALLEYQVALMKIAGIDGVIFDWYGTQDALDYKVINDATKAMIEVLREAGLYFTICYEDQIMKKMVDTKYITKDEAIETAKEDFRFMQDEWFTDPLYLSHNGRPVIMDFGPQYFKDAYEWDEIFSDLPNRPWLISLDGHSENFSNGSFNWTPMHASSSGILKIPALVSNLNNFYQRQNNKEYLVATAFPRFHDIYKEAGSGVSYGFLDDYAGETFKFTLEAALTGKAQVIQIQTWNDFGEGTTIEPTIEYGYRDLEVIQDVRKRYNDDFSFSYADLRAPIELYKIMVNEKTTIDEKNKINAVYQAIFSGDKLAFSKAIREANIQYDFSVKPLLREVSSVNVTDVELAFDAKGRKNLALGMPAVASSYIDVYQVNKMVDGDLATYWEGGAKAWPNTVSVDLVAAKDLEVMVLKLNPKRIWAKRAQTFSVLVSDNNKDFTELIPEAEYEFHPDKNQNTLVIPLNVNARAVQLIFTANTGATGGQIAELEIYAKE